MTQNQSGAEFHPIDPKEFDLPETVFSRDVENKVFQGIITETLSHIRGISPVGDSLFDQVIGRSEKMKGIYAEQDASTNSLKVKLELSVHYGINIPQKAEEIQNAVSKDLTTMTGLHVAEVHIVFKNLHVEEPQEKYLGTTPSFQEVTGTTIQEEFEDDF
jgi:uncharacterized alkaline shock family protein YloU